MRLLHLYAGNLYGGVEALLVTLARYSHLCPDMQPEFGLCFRGRLWDELLAAGVPVHDLGAARLSRPWTVWAARRQLGRVLTGGRYDAVLTHACWPHAVFAPVVRQAGVRLANMVHDTLTGGSWIDRLAARTPPDRLVCNSRHTAAAAGAVFPGLPTVVWHPPVPAPAAPDPAARASVRAALGTPTDTVVVVQASRLERWKGQAVHMAALARLRHLSGWEAWLAGGDQKTGEAEYLAELRTAADRTGIGNRVKFLGQRSDVPALLPAADIYCQPNTGPEPFGVAYLEAMYAGLPVVASAAGGPAEVVDESCGVLCPPGDAAAVADALAGLIGDPDRRRALGTAAAARAAELCEPADQVPALARLLSARLT